jgi:hypothetical protein
MVPTAVCVFALLFSPSFGWLALKLHRFRNPPFSEFTFCFLAHVSTISREMVIGRLVMSDVETEFDFETFHYSCPPPAYEGYFQPSDKQTDTNIACM